MLTAQETKDMCRMVTEMEERGKLGDRLRMHNLAEATGDEWERLVRQYLAERPAHQP